MSRDGYLSEIELALHDWATHHAEQRSGRSRPVPSGIIMLSDGITPLTQEG